MSKFYLLGLIILSIGAIDKVIAQNPEPRKGATVSSPSGLKPIPDNLPRNQFPMRSDNSSESREIPDYIVYEVVFRLAKIDWSPEEGKFVTNNPNILFCT